MTKDVTAPSDEELVAAFQRGERSAFDTLVRRWDRKIQGAIYRLMRLEDETRDLAQETFLRAYKNLGSFKLEARFSSWLYQIALNLCRDRMRRRRSKSFVSFEELDRSGENLPQAGPSALDFVLSRDIGRLVSEAVRSLPEEHREVIILKEYQGLTFAEIAEVLGIPVSTVKTRLYRGLGRLRERLEREGIHEAEPVAASLP